MEATTVAGIIGAVGTIMGVTMAVTAVGTITTGDGKRLKLNAGKTA